MVIGDFNECLWNFKHMSVTPRPEPQMVAFCDVLETCHLVDLGFSGIPFTYDNKRSGAANVKLRLDHVVASSAWHNILLSRQFLMWSPPCYDHVALMLKARLTRAR